MKVTTWTAIENPTFEDLEKVLKDKLGGKYTFKSKKKPSSLAGKLVKGSSDDTITVIKNAYHRAVVTISTVDDPTMETGKRTNIYFSSATLSGWLSFMHDQVGFVGRFIIRLIYGKSHEIYQEVEDTVQSNFKIEEETFDVGLGSLFKKKKNNS